jgi:23S rRNA pseudouridine1911/1915/1917 synthase
VNRRFTVDDRAAGERLDVYLASMLETSRSQAARLLKSGSVTINSAPERPSYLVQSGDIVESTGETAQVLPTVPPNLPVVYEDKDILVIDKPAGLTMHPGAGTSGQPTVADFARQHTTDPDPERPGIVHRLDRDTSGLVVLAKTPEAKAFLQQQFSLRQVHKTYTALVIGHPDPTTAVINLPLERDPAHPLRRAVLPGGREAVTSYRTLVDFPGYALIEAIPKTGRTHQIRVHLAGIGHPVAGDTTYGPPKRPLRLTRHFLHAAKLEFTTPLGKQIKLESPLPPDLQNTLRTLEVQV